MSCRIRPSLIAMVMSLLATCGYAGWVWKSPPNVMRPDSGRRSNVFFVGEEITFKLDARDLDRFEVRNYWGELVAKGPALPTIKIPECKSPGWYKLYVYAKPKAPPKPKAELDSLLDGNEKKPEKSTLNEAAPPPKGPDLETIWGDVVGGTTFVIFRRDPNFPEPPPPGGKGGSYPSTDQVLRGVIGMGPQRYAAHAKDPEKSIRDLAGDIAVDRELYVGRDPARPRPLMIAFPSGTKDTEGVRRIVEHFKHDVQYFEPRNEPNFGSSAADFVRHELQPFHATIKAVDPRLKVLGPGTVTIGPGKAGLVWLDEFFQAGGGKYLDAFSFHAYNNLNGDLWLGRKSLDSLTELLRRHGHGEIEKWQTEQGYFACVYGSYQPRLQGRWTMLEMMLVEQYGIPKEHNHLWYDKSHGFWDFPTWWENDDGSLNPAAPLMRVWSEELFGLRFAQRFDFGEPGNRLYIGSLFRGPHRQVAAFQSAGSPDGQVPLIVTGGETLRIVSAFGVESTLPVRDGRVTLPVPELPVYVDLAPGQQIEVVRTDWGPNLARESGVLAKSSGQAEHPVDKTIPNDIGKIVNGELENWYWSQQKDAQPWMSNVAEFPAWVEILLPKPTALSRVVVYAAPPWQWQGSLLDYELQYRDGDAWKTLEHVVEPPRTFPVYTPPTKTSVDSFYSDRWIFQHRFPPVTTSSIRLLVHDVTWGGGATAAVPKAGGQTGPHQIMLREVEVYGR